jgi:predicted MFS family arabinose efflux permease
MSSSPVLSARREALVLSLLAGVQFCHILDMMVVAPLAPQFMRLWGISAQQFAALVSIYGLAAAVSGVLASLVIDRFDRRGALLAVLAVFVGAALASALAPSYATLLAARGLAGASAGVMGSIVMAIIGDLIAPERRGRAMGLVMSAFPVVSVLGVPLSLAVAAHWSWHMPFWMIAVLATPVWLGIAARVPPVRAHLAVPRAGGLVAGFVGLVRVVNHRRALATMFVFSFSGFMVFPFLSAYQVGNVGISESELAWVFLASGLATFFTARLIGRLADRHGKRRMFVILALISILPLTAITAFPPAPLWALIAVSVPFMVFMSGRYIPLLALVTLCVAPPVRGAFMSLTAATQSLAAGLAPLAAGAIMGAAADGRLVGFWRVGLASAVLTVLCIALARRLALVQPDTPGG